MHTCATDNTVRDNAYSTRSTRQCAAKGLCFAYFAALETMVVTTSGVLTHLRTQSTIYSNVHSAY
jgi:hypothetical protein